VVGALDENVWSHCKVALATNKEEVVEFLQEFLRMCPYPRDQIVLVTDNHSAHKSKLVKEYIASQGVELIFMPPYSSVFSAQEHVWSLVKNEWGK